jgi:hypothetical protein
MNWRYTPQGGQRHAVSLGMAVAECGRTVLPASAWRGAGSQEEYERVATLPDCRRCVARVGADAVARMSADAARAVA